MLTEQTQASIGPVVAAAIAEDVGAGDLTASLIDADAVVGAQIIACEPLVLCGEEWVNEVFRQLDETVIIDWYIGDGGSAEKDDIICKLVGSTRALLTGERTALNFLQTLSATATSTAACVSAIEGSKAKVLDTRKTIPGLRLAQKYAVTCGRGDNHRAGLYDAILIKENHVKSIGRIDTAVNTARAKHPDAHIDVEVSTHEELLEALDAGTRRVLLRDFSLDQLQRAVAANEGYGYLAAELAACGNVTVDTASDIASTGVDYVAIEEITETAGRVELAMLFRID